MSDNIISLIRCILDIIIIICAIKLIKLQTNNRKAMFEIKRAIQKEKLNINNNVDRFENYRDSNGLLTGKRKFTK